MKPTGLICSFIAAAALPLSAATNLIFIHHSVGENWLNDGQLNGRLTAAGFSVHDATYGDAVPGPPDSAHSPIGDYTDVCHWYYWFNFYLPGIIEWECTAGQSNMIVMFKSCYPNSGIDDDGTPPGDPTNENHTVWNHKAAYLSLTNVFATHSAIMFIAVTAPPMKKGDGYYEPNAARARAFHDWLRTDYVNEYRAVTGLRNLAVFDLFDVLTTSRTLAKNANALDQKLASRDSHPSPKGSREMTASFLPFFRTALDCWGSGTETTNAFLKCCKAVFKTSRGSLQVSGWVDSAGGTPGDARILIGGTVVQTFPAAAWRATSSGYKATALAFNGKTASIKLATKTTTAIMFKGFISGPPTSPVPVIIDLGNGRTFAIDLLLDDKGKFP